MLSERIRRPPFRHHGRKVVAGLCGYELVALSRHSPLPTISELVERHRDTALPLGIRIAWGAFGGGLLLLLAHHWYVEMDGAELIGSTIAAATDVADVLASPT